MQTSSSYSSKCCLWTFNRALKLNQALKTQQHLQQRNAGKEVDVIIPYRLKNEERACRDEVGHTGDLINSLELVVPSAWRTHACNCDVISETAEPGILVCWRLHKNIRQRWVFVLSICGAEFSIAINRWWAFMRPLLQVQQLSAWKCMGPTWEPVSRRLWSPPRKGKVWQQWSWCCLIWAHLSFFSRVVKLSAHTESESAMRTRTSADQAVYLTMSCLQMLTLEPSMRKYLQYYTGMWGIQFS